MQIQIFSQICVHIHIINIYNIYICTVHVIFSLRSIHLSSDYSCNRLVSRVENFNKIMNNKKKHTCLSLQTKMKIIEESKQGSSITCLAKKYGVAKSTICSIKNKSEKLAAVISSTYYVSGNRKTMRRGEIPETEKKLYEWFLQQRERNLPVNSVLIKQLALKLFKLNEGSQGGSFNASDGWMQKFKNRFGIRLIKVSSQPEYIWMQKPSHNQNQIEDNSPEEVVSGDFVIKYEPDDNFYEDDQQTFSEASNYNWERDLQTEVKLENNVDYDDYESLPLDYLKEAVLRSQLKTLKAQEAAARAKEKFKLYKLSILKAENEKPTVV